LNDINLDIILKDLKEQW